MGDNTIISLLVTRSCHRSRCCATSCKSRPLKPKKPLELCRPFFSLSLTTTTTTNGSREMRGSAKSLIHLGRWNLAWTCTKTKTEGWIMMIVETTYGESYGTFPTEWAVFGCIAHPSVTHNCQPLAPSPPVCSLSSSSPRFCRARIDKWVLFHPYSSWGKSLSICTDRAYFSAKLPQFSNRSSYNNDRVSLGITEIRYRNTGFLLNGRSERYFLTVRIRFRCVR